MPVRIGRVVEGGQAEARVILTFYLKFYFKFTQHQKQLSLIVVRWLPKTINNAPTELTDNNQPAMIALKQETPPSDKLTVTA